MARLVYHSQSPFTSSLGLAKRWAPSLGIWGIGAGAAAILVLSVTPLVRRELLVKVPILDSYYEDKTPASDKPF